MVGCEYGGFWSYVPRFWEFNFVVLGCSFDMVGFYVYIVMFEDIFGVCVYNCWLPSGFIGCVCKRGMCKWLRVCACI